MHVNLGIDRISTTELMQALGTTVPGFTADIEDSAVHTVLIACYVASDPDHHARIAACGLDGLANALVDRDEDRILAFAESIASMLGVSDLARTTNSILAFLSQEPYRSDLPVEFVHPADEIAETVVDDAVANGNGGADGEPGQG